MELIEKKDVNPRDYHFAKINGSNNYVVEKDGEQLAIVFGEAFDDFISIFAMAGALYNFQNKKGAFAHDDLASLEESYKPE